MSLKVTLSKSKGLLYAALCSCFRHIGRNRNDDVSVISDNTQNQHGNRNKPEATPATLQPVAPKQKSNDTCASTTVDESDLDISSFFA